MNTTVSLRTPLSLALETASQSKPTRVQEAARQFEALMIGQMLRSARQAAKDDSSDSSSETMMDIADQQFSQLLATNGGLGLAQMIVKGLIHEDRQQRSEPGSVTRADGSNQSVVH